MTTRTDYTDEEWKTLLDLPRLAAFGAMAAEAGGAVASTRELWAAMHQMATAAQIVFPANALIQKIVAEITGGGDDAVGTDVAWRPKSGELLGVAIVEQATETAARARAILNERSTPVEASEYAAWVLAIARAGCEAAGSGLFGLRGERVSPSEAQFVADLAASLGES